MPEPSAVVVKLTVGASLTSVIVTICCVLVPVSALTGVPKSKTIFSSHSSMASAKIFNAITVPGLTSVPSPLIVKVPPPVYPL